jgi:hypothetical protein
MPVLYAVTGVVFTGFPDIPSSGGGERRAAGGVMRG